MSALIEDSSKRNLLLVSYYCPTKYHAGGLRVLDMYAMLRRLYKSAKIDLYTIKRPEIDGDYSSLENIFDRVFFSKKESLTLGEFVELQAKVAIYDVVDMQFHEAALDIDRFRSIAGKIIFTPMELLLRSLLIELHRCLFAPASVKLRTLSSFYHMALKEIGLAKKADLTVCVSKTDASALKLFSMRRNVWSLDTGLSPCEFSIELSAKYCPINVNKKGNNIIYLAYFGSETNVLALEWYLEKVHSIVKEKVPDYKLMVVGRGDITRFEKYQDEHLMLIGEVDKIAPAIHQAKVGIAPALGGSGFRGKVNQYAVCGVPCVASPIVAEGLVYRDGADICIERNPKAFAMRCISLLDDDGMNQTMRMAARNTCLQNYTWESKVETLRRIYGSRDQMNIQVVFSPKITAIVTSYNHAPFLRKRIESIQKQTYKNIELIVIDDCSQDDSESVIKEMAETRPFLYLKTPKNSGSPFGSWGQALSQASGDFIWICESDDYCTNDFIETAVNAFKSQRDAVLYYCGSHIVDQSEKVIGHTNDYFHNIWREERWDASFKSNGQAELNDFQVRGQTVPNLSSAVFSADAFRRSYREDLSKYKLTGDWVFVGRVMQFGFVIYNSESKSFFREHQNTARVRVGLAKSQAEFVIARFTLFQLSELPFKQFHVIFGSDGVRFLHESDKWYEVVRQMLAISVWKTLRVTMLLACSFALNPNYIRKFIKRLKLVRSLR